MRSVSGKVLIWCLAWLGGFLVTAIGLGLMTHIQSSFELSRESVLISGSVTATFCERHQEFGYQFEVGGKIFSGVGVAPSFEVCARRKPGDSVSVYYYPKSPEVNTIGNTNAAFSNELVSILIASLAIPTVVILGVLLKRRDRVSKAHQDELRHS